MMKKLVSVLLVVVMLATMAPIYAFAYDEEEYFARYDVTLKSTSTNWIDGYYFVYTIGGKEFRSDLTGSRINYMAWTMMTDADKKKAAKVFFNKRDREEAFGAENAKEVAEFVSNAQGYSAVANKLKEKVEKKYISNDLIQLFSDTVVDKDNDLSYYQRTINTEFDIEDYEEVVYKYEFFIDSHAAKQAYARARYAMDSGHEIYKKLKSLHELAWQLSVKATAGELGKYLANNAIVPPLTPGASVNDLKDAAWGFVKDLASQLGVYKTKSDIIQDLLYGKDIVSKDDACKVIKEVNELSEMYESQCRECYAEAKYQINYVKSLMNNLKKLNADYDKKVEENRIKAQQEMEEATNPEPDTVVQSIIENDIEATQQPGTDPGPFTGTLDTAEYFNWINNTKSYHNSLYNRAVALKATYDKLEAEWADFATDFTAWQSTWESTVETLVDDDVPIFYGDYIDTMLLYDEVYFKHFASASDTSDDFNLCKKSVTNISNYYDNLSLYLSKHINKASTTLETEMEKYKAFQKRYLDIQEAVMDYGKAYSDLIYALNSNNEWSNVGDWGLKSSADAIIDESFFEHSYSELYNEFGNIQGEVEMPLVDVNPLRRLGVLNNWHPQSNYSNDERCGRYTYDEDNILRYIYCFKSGRDFIELLQSQVDNEEKVCNELTIKAKALRETFEAYKFSRDEYIAEMKESVSKYNTARDNYELARRTYIPALEDMKNLNNQLPNYVREQKLLNNAVHYLRATQRSDNPIIYDDLHNNSNRAGAIAKYRSQLKGYYERYKRNLRIMENAYESMERYANEMTEQYEIFCWMHPEYRHNDGFDYFKDFGIFRPSPGVYDEYEFDFGLLPNYYDFAVQRYKYNDNTYFIQLEALYKDFAGVNEAQAEADLSTHMLLINKSAIIHEGKNGDTKRLDAIYSRYNNACGTAYAHSWVGLGDDGENDPDFIKTYNSIRDAIVSYINVNKFSKGNTPKAKKITDLEIQEGKIGQLYATIEPANATDKTIIWASKTPDIATIDNNGKVTALNDGEAIIIAYPADSIAVPIDTEGNELDEDDDGTPVVPNDSVFGGYTYKLPDENGELESAVLEYIVDVTADQTPGAEWNKVKPYSGVYDGNCHLAIDTTGLNNYDVTFSTDDGENYTGVCPIIDAVGNYNIKVKLTSAFDSEAEGEVRNFTASISKYDITDKDIEVIYGKQLPVDGEEHDVVISRIIIDGMELTTDDYKLVSGNKASTIAPQSIVISGLNNFNGISAPSAEKWTLQKPEPTIEDFDVLPIEAVSYTGKAVEITPPTSNKDGIGSVTIKYNGSKTPPVDAGEYEVTFDVEEGDFFTGTKNFQLGTLVINKADYTENKEATGRIAFGYNDDCSSPLPALPEGAMYCINEITISGESPEIISDISCDGERIYYYINAGSELTSAVVTIPVRNAKNYNDYEVVFTAKVYDPGCNHIWDNGKFITQPTCIEYGFKEYECTICGAGKYEYTDKTDHDYEKAQTPATCLNYGTIRYTCKNCGRSYEEYTNAIGHNYSSYITKPATCSESGLRTYICSNCDDAYTEAIPKADHTPKAVPAVAPTCTKTGLTEGSKCLVCDEIIKAQTTVAKKAHATKTTVTKATLSKDGKSVTKCTVCGTTTSTKTIAYPKTISLSATSYTYDGKAKKPNVTVKDSKGNKIAASNYSVSYASGRKVVGKYAVKITFKGNYSGTKTLYFTIVPKATSISSVTAASKGFTVKWKKQATQTTGYEIQYATDSKFTKNKKTVTVKKNSTTSKKVTKLKGKTKYYVRVRTYKTVKVNGKSTKIYSAWSKSKSVTTKK